MEVFKVIPITPISSTKQALTFSFKWRGFFKPVNLDINKFLHLQKPIKFFSKVPLIFGKLQYFSSKYHLYPLTVLTF